MSQKTACSVIRCPDLETLWKKGGGLYSLCQSNGVSGAFSGPTGTNGLPAHWDESLFCEMSFTFLDRTLQQPLEARGSQGVGEDTGVLGERGSRVHFQER